MADNKMKLGLMAITQSGFLPEEKLKHLHVAIGDSHLYCGFATRCRDFQINSFS